MTEKLRFTTDIDRHWFTNRVVNDWNRLGRHVVIAELIGSSKRQYKLEKLRFRTDIDRHWFTNRVVNDWNRLSRHVVSAESIGSFKRRLDECMDRDDRWDG